MYLKHAFLRYLKRFGPVAKRWKHENKDAHACNMASFDTVLRLAEKKIESNGAKWWILTLFESYARRLLGDSIVLLTPFIFIESLDVLFVLIFLDEV